MDKNQYLVLKNISLGRYNTTGKSETYNRAGNRYLEVILTDSLADSLKLDGWNVKRPENKLPFLVVTIPVTYDAVSEKDLDGSDIEVFGYFWELADMRRSGIKAYLKSHVRSSHA